MDVSSSSEHDELKIGKEKIVLFFYAEWHDPSKNQMLDVLSTLARKYGDICFAKVNVEALPELTTAYNVEVVPTSVCLNKGVVAGKVAGANPPELTKLVRALKSASAAATSSSTGSTIFKADLNSRLKQLIATAPVMLFMKGTPAEPRCGFSRKIVALLKEHAVPFASFNILEDEEVRQGLKVYSEWPTFPQLYVRSELQGGLDILNEMAAEGSLKDQFLGKDDTSTTPGLEVSAPALDDRLKALIESNKVMLFMKGHPDQPKCGFSNTIVGILKQEGVEFGHFDILSDEEVRQGLKKYSDWPTYPQLYVNGELVGGLDIVQEMLADGPLKNQLQV